MTVRSIDSIEVDGKTIRVQAVVSESVCTFPGSQFDPPEYDDALCVATFEADDETPAEITPDYLDLLDLDWSLC
jgi:hypothetical protein